MTSHKQLKRNMRKRGERVSLFVAFDGHDLILDFIVDGSEEKKQIILASNGTKLQVREMGWFTL